MLRILIVEDSDDLRFILKTELEWVGYTVELARDGKAGIELARRIRPDVIVSDITMPGIDGLEFIRRVRKIPELAAIPVIALTGLAPTPELHRAFASEFAAHLIKPVEASALCDVIRRLTEKRLRLKAS